MASESIAHSDSEPIQAQGIIVKDRKHVTILTQTKYCVHVPALAAHTVQQCHDKINQLLFNSCIISELTQQDGRGMKTANLV